MHGQVNIKNNCAPYVISQGSQGSTFPFCWNTL